MTVTNSTKGRGEGEPPRSRCPPGGRSSPPSRHVRFAREDEADTCDSRDAATGREARARTTLRRSFGPTARSFDQGYQVIEYPHIHRRHVHRACGDEPEVIDVKVAAAATWVGYVMGVGDQVPPAHRATRRAGGSARRRRARLGRTSSRFDAIVTGVRAYERRARPASANNRRLLEYAEQGGTVIVQYNKFEFNQAQYGPYPAKEQLEPGDRRDRAGRRCSIPAHPVFNVPNRIDDAAWKGWVQERGLYFLGEQDPRYVDLVELAGPVPCNAGMKRGALVEAKVGKGRWVYVGARALAPAAGGHRRRV